MRHFVGIFADLHKTAAGEKPKAPVPSALGAMQDFGSLMHHNILQQYQPPVKEEPKKPGWTPYPQPSFTPEDMARLFPPKQPPQQQAPRQAAPAALMPNITGPEAPRPSAWQIFKSHFRKQPPSAAQEAVRGQEQNDELARLQSFMERAKPIRLPNPAALETDPMEILRQANKSAGIKTAFLGLGKRPYSPFEEQDWTQGFGGAGESEQEKLIQKIVQSIPKTEYFSAAGQQDPAKHLVREVAPKYHLGEIFRGLGRGDPELGARLFAQYMEQHRRPNEAPFHEALHAKLHPEYQGFMTKSMIGGGLLGLLGLGLARKMFSGGGQEPSYRDMAREQYMGGDQSGLKMGNYKFADAFKHAVRAPYLDMPGEIPAEMTRPQARYEHASGEMLPPEMIQIGHPEMMSKLHEHLSTHFGGLARSLDLGQTEKSLRRFFQSPLRRAISPRYWLEHLRSRGSALPQAQQIAAALASNIAPASYKVDPTGADDETRRLMGAARMPGQATGQDVTAIKSRLGTLFGGGSPEQRARAITQALGRARTTSAIPSPSSPSLLGGMNLAGAGAGMKLSPWKIGGGLLAAYLLSRMLRR